jgi:hypothetical protein
MHTQVMKDMKTFLTGDPKGHAFVTHRTSDAGMGLAALVVARFSKAKDTIWNLCGSSSLRALPITILGMDRSLVCLAKDTTFEWWDVTMLDVEYLLGDDVSATIYDGAWEVDSGPYKILSVRE